MTQRYLKVPEDFIRRVNEQGVWSEVEFYYQLKCLKEHGSFRREDFRLISNTYGYANSTLYSKFRRLINLGLIKQNGEYFELISYANLWIKFGYNIDYCLNPLNNKNKSFKIYKIDIRNIEHLKENIYVSEIEHNFNKQNWNGRRKFLLTQKKNEVKTVKKGSSYLPAPRLAIRKITELFGFTSSSTGYNILKDLEELGYIEVISQRDNNGLPLCNIIIVIHERTILPG